MGMSSTNGACGSDPNSRDNQKAASKYTDSKYAYLTLHAHAIIWKESLKHKQEKLQYTEEKLKNIYIYSKE